MKLRNLLILLVTSFLLVTALGCEDDPAGNNGGFTIPNNGTGNNSNNGNSNNSNNGETDMGGNEEMGPDIDMNVENAGFLHGRWNVFFDESTTPDAVLTFVHEAGESTATGTYSMTLEVEGTKTYTGGLNGTNWINDELTTSWEPRINNSDETYGVSAAGKTSDNQLEGKYTATLGFKNGDARLERIVE